MNVSELATAVYPALLAATNIGLGVVLYENGSLVVAAVMGVTGVVVLACLVSALGPLRARSSRRSN